MPAGPCHFTVALNRTLDMPKFAASHILDSQPVLKGPAEYTIPPGSGDDPELDEDGQPVENPDKPPLPTLATGCAERARAHFRRAEAFMQGGTCTQGLDQGAFAQALLDMQCACPATHGMGLMGPS